MRTRDRLCVAFGGAALLASTLVVGGVLRWTQATVAILVAFALLTQIASRRKLDRVSPIVLLLVIAIVATALQLLPLPVRLVEILNPTNAALRNDGAAIAHASPWSCLSMDFAGTLRGLTYLITLLGVALVSLRLGASERGRLLLVGGVAIACGLVAIVTALHSIVNASLLYGIWEVPNSEPVVSPFINPNHLGCLMAFGATISIGLAFYEKQTAAWRAVWVVTAAGCAAMALLSESRGATVSLALGAIVTSALIVSRRLGEVARESRRHNLTMSRLPIVVVLTLGFALAVYSSAGGVAEQLGKTSLVEIGHPVSKFAAWKASSELVREAPWTGVGRGAVEPVFTHAFPGSAQVTFGHLENEYIEAVVEWGIPTALVLAVVLGWCIVTGLRKWRDGPLAAAAIGGLAGVMFQSSVDFGIELLGVAVPVTIVASTIQLVPLREAARLGSIRVVRAVIILALAISSIALLRPWTSTLEEDHAAMLAGDYKTLEQLATTIDRHPLDYFAFGTAGQMLVRAHDERAAMFLNHALRLHPYQPGLHRLVARLLIRIGAREQAALEYSLAMSGAPPHLLLKEIIAELPAADEASLAIPTDFPAPDSIVGSLAELHRSDIAERWLIRRALERSTQDIEQLDMLYRIALDRTDYDVALRAAHARLEVANTPTSRSMIARILFAQKKYADVYVELADVESWKGRIDERADAWLLVCDSYRDERRWDEAMQCLHKLDGTGSMASRRDALIKRESAISEVRTSEIRIKQIQDLERSMHLPVDSTLPVLRGSGAPEPIPNPLTSSPIQNPLRNPPPKP